MVLFHLGVSVNQQVQYSGLGGTTKWNAPIISVITYI